MNEKELNNVIKTLLIHARDVELPEYNEFYVEGDEKKLTDADVYEIKTRLKKIINNLKG